jgi:predicted alpha-1,6-mannanase (GH76 family)
MRNSQGLYNDGLSSNCQNNGQTTWTYNQGVIASGLASLYVTTGSTNTTLLDQAEITLDATIAHLTQNGILKESCDNAAATSSPSCDNDQLIFKGIWTKHLQYYLDLANDPKRTAKYSSFLGAQSSAVYYYGTNANGDIGNVWYAPSQGGSIFKPQSSASGLAALNAAAKVCLLLRLLPPLANYMSPQYGPC